MQNKRSVIFVFNDTSGKINLPEVIAINSAEDLSVKNSEPADSSFLAI